jgi:hypothetical protein
MNRALINDHIDRRSGGDRRHFSYGVYIPERRLIKDRRSGRDRRNQDRRLVLVDSDKFVSKFNGEMGANPKFF